MLTQIPSILIVSGVDEFGKVEIYRGAGTGRAVRQKYKKVMRSGARWCKVYTFVSVDHKGEYVYNVAFPGGGEDISFTDKFLKNIGAK